MDDLILFAERPTVNPPACRRTMSGGRRSLPGASSRLANHSFYLVPVGPESVQLRARESGC